MTYLFLYPITNPIASFDQLLGRLPIIIQNRILRKKQQKKRQTSLLGYVLLQNVLSQYFGANLNNLTFLSSGKPILKLPHQILSFNISHTNDLVGLVIGSESALGLDIEAFRKFEQVESSFSFFSSVEQSAILNAEKPRRKLIELWSKKEALVKAVGGRMFDMAAYTDVRSNTVYWDGQTYELLPINYDFDGFIWVASLSSIRNINVKIVQDLNKIEEK